MSLSACAALLRTSTRPSPDYPPPLRPLYGDSDERKRNRSNFREAPTHSHARLCAPASRRQRPHVLLSPLPYPSLLLSRTPARRPPLRPPPTPPPSHVSASPTRHRPLPRTATQQQQGGHNNGALRAAPHHQEGAAPR